MVNRQAGAEIEITPAMGAEFFLLVADVLHVDPPMYETQEIGAILLDRARRFFDAAQCLDKRPSSR